MNIFKNKNFWFSVAHIATAAASAAIIPLQALINGIVPSPLNTVAEKLPPLDPVIPQPLPSIIDNSASVGSTFTRTPSPIGLSIGDEIKMQDKVK